MQENWGLITFDEAALLYDPLRSSEATEQTVAVTIVHELAHQWHGNLVTMAWWYSPCARCAPLSRRARMFSSSRPPAFSVHRPVGTTCG